MGGPSQPLGAPRAMISPLLAAMTVFCADPAAATGFLNEAVTVDGTEHRYVLYVPRDYAADRAWPLVVFLHGAGERGADGLKQSDVGIGRAIRLNPERFPCLVLMPQCPEEHFWDSMIPAIEAMMEKAKAAYTVDVKRVTLTGLSMGGYGAWIWGPVKKDVFAAFMPICGGGSFADIRRFCPKAGEDVFPSMEERGKLLADRPVWAFHGKDDDVVPPFRTRQMVRAVEKAGGKPRLTEYPGTGHNSWDQAYGDPEAVAWLLAQKLPD